MQHIPTEVLYIGNRYIFASAILDFIYILIHKWDETKLNGQYVVFVDVDDDWDSYFCFFFGVVGGGLTKLFSLV